MGAGVMQTRAELWWWDYGTYQYIYCSGSGWQGNTAYNYYVAWSATNSCSGTARYYLGRGYYQIAGVYSTDPSYPLDITPWILH